MKRFQLSLWVCLVVCFGFSTYAQDTKEIIILQTSDVHSRIEPINQKGDRNYDEGGCPSCHFPRPVPQGT